MEQSEKESIREASKEASAEFKTLINEDDLDSLKQLQHLMYTNIYLRFSILFFAAFYWFQSRLSIQMVLQTL